MYFFKTHSVKQYVSAIRYSFTILMIFNKLVCIFLFVEKFEFLFVFFYFFNFVLAVPVEVETLLLERESTKRYMR